MLSNLLLDLEPLRRDRSFRWLWLGELVSTTGRQLTLIALPYQVYLLTGSPLAIGALSAVTLVALVVFSLPGGALADAYDRRRLLLITQSGLALTSLLLAAIALMGAPPIVPLYLVAFLAASISTIDGPSRRAVMPRLVPPERLPTALILQQVGGQAATVVGPAVGGLLIAALGIPAAYLVDAISFGATILAVLLLPPLRPEGTASRPGLQSIREGLQFLRRAPVILAGFAVDLDAMIFGMPTALFPILAVSTFHAGAETLGLLTAAPAVGALVMTLTAGWVGRVRRQGRAVLVAAAIWGLAIAGFGLSIAVLPLALVFLAVAGAADVLSAVFRNTVLQLATPDRLRGRLSAIHGLVVLGGPRLGDVEATTVAAVAGAPFSAFIGGILCVAGLAVVARRFPELDEYDAGGTP
jgi:MFS family permease